MSGELNRLRVVAIDGPAGAGKSTVARALARRLGLRYLDTGAMYRAVTAAALDRDIDLADAAAIARLARTIDIDVTDAAVTVDGADVTVAIRTAAVTAAVSALAANSGVRDELRRRQREWAVANGGGVIEGRDIGTVVFPDAVLKLYLTASPRVRAQRRVGEAGGDVDEMERTIAARDHSDANRTDGPLREGTDAVVIDTSALTIAEVVSMLAALVAEREHGVMHAPDGDR